MCGVIATWANKNTRFLRGEGRKKGGNSPTEESTERKEASIGKLSENRASSSCVSEENLI